jgi:hypothetical protein
VRVPGSTGSWRSPVASFGGTNKNRGSGGESAAPGPVSSVPLPVDQSGRDVRPHPPHGGAASAYTGSTAGRSGSSPGDGGGDSAGASSPHNRNTTFVARGCAVGSRATGVSGAGEVGPVAATSTGVSSGATATPSEYRCRACNSSPSPPRINTRRPSLTLEDVGAHDLNGPSGSRTLNRVSGPLGPTSENDPLLLGRVAFGIRGGTSGPSRCRVDVGLSPAPAGMARSAATTSRHRWQVRTQGRRPRSPRRARWLEAR